MEEAAIFRSIFCYFSVSFPLPLSGKLFCRHPWLQCVLKFQSDHAQWRSKRGSGGMHPGVQVLEAHQQTLFRHSKTSFFGRNLAQNAYF